MRRGTSSWTLVIAASIVGVVVGVSLVVYFLPSNSRVSGAHPPTLLFGMWPQSGNYSTATIPADTLAWTNWVTNSSLSPTDETATFSITPQNYNSTLTMAVYVDGALVQKSNYVIASAPTPSSILSATATPGGHDSSYFTGTGGTTPIPAGSTVSIAVFCSTPLIAYVSGSGQSFEASVTSVPSQLPTPANSMPFAIQMAGYD